MRLCPRPKGMALIQEEGATERDIETLDNNYPLNLKTAEIRFRGLATTELLISAFRFPFAWCGSGACFDSLSNVAQKYRAFLVV